MPANFREVGTDGGDLNDCLDICLATGIGGSIVSESLEIVRVCQDRDNLGIIFMEVVLSGVFDYNIQLVVEWEDPQGNIKSVNVSSRFILSYKHAADSPSSLPVSTNCGTVNLLLAWDVAALIPNWGSLTEVTCKLKMFGDFISHSFDEELLIKLGELFSSIDPEASIVLRKGPTPVPYALYFDEATGQLKIQYSGLAGLPCYCDIDCANIDIAGQELVICDDEIQELTLDINSIVGDPTNLSVTFTDVLGNSTVLNSSILFKVKPKPPGGIYQATPRHVQILPFWVTENNVVLSQNTTQYQIWKFTNTRDNVILLKDWSSKAWSTLFDRDISVGNLYGYAIRFRGDFGEISDLSEWSEVDLQDHLDYQPPTIAFSNLFHGPIHLQGSPISVSIAKYNIMRVEETGSNLLIPYELVGDDKNTQFIHYTIGGNAQLGVNFNIVTGESPIRVERGETGGNIEISFIDTEAYFEDKFAHFVLSGTSSPGILEQNSEVQVWIESVNEPPRIYFTETAITLSAAGEYSGDIAVYTPDVTPGDITGTNEDITIYWTVTGGTALEGTDYNWTAEPPHLKIPLGENTGVIPITILPGYTAGRYLHVHLAHEPAGRSGMNFSIDTEQLGPFGLTAREGLGVTGIGTSGEVWPSSPNEWVGGGVDNGPTPTFPFQDSVKTIPFYHNSGEYMWGVATDVGASGIGYFRWSFEAELYCGGATTLHNMQHFNRFSMYIEHPTDIAYPRYPSITLRNRNENKNHVIKFDSDNDFTGSVVSNWTGNLSDFGVVTGSTEMGTSYTRLWLTHHEDGDFTGDGLALLIHPAATASHNLVDITNSGWLFYGMMLEGSATQLEGPPGDYFPRLRSSWEPRGAAVIDGTGSTQVITLA